MQKIFEALVTTLQGTRFLSGGGIWNGEAPANVVAPFVVFKLAGSPADYLHGVKQRQLTFSIVLHSKSMSAFEINNMYALLKTTLDEKTLMITGYDGGQCAEINANLHKYKDEWLYDCTYIIDVSQEI